jgi:hypothetical protein
MTPTRRLDLVSAYTQLHLGITDDNLCIINVRTGTIYTPINDVIEQFWQQPIVQAKGILVAEIFNYETGEITPVETPWDAIRERNNSRRRETILIEIERLQTELTKIGRNSYFDVFTEHS